MADETPAMKLVFAVVDDEDAGPIIEELARREVTVTRLASTGGFLRRGNTTLFTVVESQAVDSVLDALKLHSRERERVHGGKRLPVHNLAFVIPVDALIKR